MKKIQTLDSIRLIMISTIILSHMEFLGSTTGTMNSYDLYFHNAYMGVNYFFLLSGFGLTLSFLNRRRTWSVDNCWSMKALFKYAIKRVRGILPLYGFTMAVMIPYEISHLSNGGDKTCG